MRKVERSAGTQDMSTPRPNLAAREEELMPLEGNGRESCVAQFIDMCDDMVVDGQISVDEWCDCFTFADDLRHEPPCHKKKHSVDPHMTALGKNEHGRIAPPKMGGTSD
ncbi:hypothetical protein TELCIR_18910 [Teladorsagia circumcincta]|uniref:SPARC/Testican calcium-binding domain-containing protein n=2 Tax=Teladorsagia circumcincta TaxID=45464 RepID=A0A2G9TNN5_TELCI|nr:hypothetical protein TELCIR_18910 [Teladorsagia circumcincta]